MRTLQLITDVQNHTLDDNISKCTEVVYFNVNADKSANELKMLSADLIAIIETNRIIKESQQDEKNNTAEINLAKIAVENFTRRWDVTSISPATESRGFTKTIACESLGETIRSGIKKLILLIAKLISKIKQIVSSTIDNKTIEHVRKLTSAVNKLRRAGSKPKSRHLETKSPEAIFSIKGDMSVSETNNFFANQLDTMTTALNKLSAMAINWPFKSVEAVPKIVDIVFGVECKHLKLGSYVSDPAGVLGENVDGVKCYALPCRANIIVGYKYSRQLLSIYHTDVHNFDPIYTLSTYEMLDVLKSIEQAITYRDNTLKPLGIKVIDALNHLNNHVEKITEEMYDSGKLDTGMLAFGSDISSYLSTVYSKYVRMIDQFIPGALHYVSESIKTY